MAQYELRMRRMPDPGMPEIAMSNLFEVGVCWYFANGYCMSKD